MKTCILSLLSIPETEKNALKRPEPHSERYTGTLRKKSGKFCNFIYPALFEPVAAITAKNGDHYPGVGNDSARGFSDTVVGDGFAIDRKI